MARSQRFTPGLGAAVPDGWMVRESIELASAEQGYVLASAELLPSELTSQEYAERYGKQLGDRLSGYEEIGVDTVDLSGGQAIFRSFRWKPSEGQEIAELHRYSVHNRRGVVARAICPADRFAELEPELRALLSSIGYGTPAPQRGVLRREETPRTRTYAAFEAGQMTTMARQASSGDDGNGDAGNSASNWQQARESWQRGRSKR